jgi:hexokinase
MDAVQWAARRFLKRYRLLPEDIDMEAVCEDFEGDMAEGLQSHGGGQSLMMLPTYLKLEADIPLQKPVIALDAGGTNLRVALVRFGADRGAVIEDFQNYAMPGTEGAVSKEAFFDAVARYLEPLLDKSDQIGFCFSFPAAIRPDGDGEVLKLSKELRVDGLVGALVNRSLLDAIRKIRPAARKSVVLLNDTVATLLGGKTVFPDRVFESYIGMILGTGTNLCYAERRENIGKLGDAAAFDGASMLINVESGNFNKAPTGPLDARMDQRTQDPGKYLFEKAISGAYQGRLLAEIVKQAAADALFPAGARERFAQIGALTARDIDLFLYRPYAREDNALAACCGDSADSARILYELIDAMLERIAMFTAVSITAILRKTGTGKNPNAPACVTVDGSTFYKSKLLKSKVDYHIRRFTNEGNNLYCELVKAENGVLKGTAIAALQNCR